MSGVTRNRFGRIGRGTQEGIKNPSGKIKRGSINRNLKNLSPPLPNRGEIDAQPALDSSIKFRRGGINAQRQSCLVYIDGTGLRKFDGTMN